MKHTVLNNGVEIPIVGLGTWRSEGNDAYNAVLYALKNGYQHIDTAMIYGNEVEVGKAIRDSKIPREEIFITSKVWNPDQGYKSTKKAFQLTLEKLQIDYLDLYLIHWPQDYKKEIETYRAMEELYNEGKIRAIGVSNFNIHHLDNIINNCSVIPAINQVECHVELQNHKMKQYCDERGITLEAYAPLMSDKVGDLLNKPELQVIARKYNKSVAQVALKWNIQRGVVVVPKSIFENEIVENLNIFDFELSDEDMRVIRKLNSGNRTFPEPDNIDF